MSTADSLNGRVIELESIVTHLQRDLNALNSVILEQQTEIERLRRRMERLEDRLQGLADDTENGES